MQLCMHARQAYKCSTTEVHAIEREKEDNWRKQDPTNIEQVGWNDEWRGNATASWALFRKRSKAWLRCWRRWRYHGVCYFIPIQFNRINFCSCFSFVPSDAFPLFGFYFFSILPFHSVHICVLRICQYNHTSCCQLVLVYFFLFSHCSH